MLLSIWCFRHVFFFCSFFIPHTHKVREEAHLHVKAIWVNSLRPALLLSSSGEVLIAKYIQSRSIIRLNLSIMYSTALFPPKCRWKWFYCYFIHLFSRQVSRFVFLLIPSKISCVFDLTNLWFLKQAVSPFYLFIWIRLDTSGLCELDS